ncbi:MAG: TRAP transporter small permease [Xanthobacteraceae bacterium]
MSAIDEAPQRPSSNLDGGLNLLSRALAYMGGTVVAMIGLMSATSIIGRTILGRPILGDFELVEMGTAIAGSLFIPYCQLTYGHIAVDFFTQKASKRICAALDRFGALLMAVMYFAVGWRTSVGAIDIWRSGETTMLMGVPIWIGYAGMLPGIFAAGIVALAQAVGILAAERPADE